MKNISVNVNRLILGGLVAGAVRMVLGLLVDGVLLATLWSDDMISLARPEFSNTQWFEFSIIWLAFGIVCVWIYVAMRSLLGAGWITAVIAGVTAWTVGVLLPNAGYLFVMGLFSKHLALYTTVGGLVEVVAGTVAGAWLYKEN